MKFTPTHITVMVCTLLVGLFAAILAGKVAISPEVAKEFGIMAVGVLSGWLGLRRPGDTPTVIAQKAVELARSVPPPPLAVDVQDKP